MASQPERNIPHIEEPDLTSPDAFREWVARNVNKPLGGYEDKKYEDQTPYSLEEQVELSRKQLD